MKANQTYLNGKSVFTVSLIVIVITILTVYFTGINYNRSLTSNFYISLSIISTALFVFMSYGLYKGVILKDDFPKFKSFKTGDIIPDSGTIPDLPSIDLDLDDELGAGILLSIVLWIVMTILFLILLVLLEAVFWVSIFIILAMLYWIFFRALKLVFAKSKDTIEDLGNSMLYAIGYTALYTGWIFGIVYISQILK
ncbi:hypothetical protein [uncultured Aquimarina sp.]|uniref:hypothetical protein n=1 Tax=uncultured Aquimarina sp. TaxID=575652 RepID=UPI002629B16F|nr:hypothetical protein [uncultured Aquimarina sp.]